MRRTLVLIPVLVLFLAIGVIFLAAHAPRTWASHWTDPVIVAPENGASEFGTASTGRSSWDLLWVNDQTNQLIFSRALSTGAFTAQQIDSGDVHQPTLVRAGGYEVGVWVHNFNGSTELKGEVLQPAVQRRTFTLIVTKVPIEHPYLFAAPHGAIGLVFSWQKHGNFDVYLTTLTPGAKHFGVIHRLTASQYYSFYPRAVTDGRGGIDLLHLESCCSQQGWNVELRRYSSDGHPLSPTSIVHAIRYPGQAPDVGQWGEDLRTDSSGNVWGAFGGLFGAFLFGADATGKVIHPAVLVDPTGPAPQSIAIAVGRGGGYVFWEQPYSLGSYVLSRQFDSSLRLGGPERVEYLSGHQTNPHAAVVRSIPSIIWQSWSDSGSPEFEITSHRSAQGPNLAQRLGLGLGNPWEEAAVLSVGSFVLATLATAVNLMIVVVLALIGMLLVRATRRLPGRWLIYSCFLTVVLYAAFVVPGGGPTLFLTSLPALGLAAVPFGILASLGSMFFVTWVGQTALKRIDDMYRAAIMAFLSIYFIAFLEAAVFIQQRIGYI